MNIFLKIENKSYKLAAMRGRCTVNNTNEFYVELFEHAHTQAKTGSININNQFRQTLHISDQIQKNNKTCFVLKSDAEQLKHIEKNHHHTHTNIKTILNKIIPFEFKFSTNNLPIRQSIQYKQNNLEFLKQLCSEHNLFFYQNEKLTITNGVDTKSRFIEFFDLEQHLSRDRKIIHIKTKNASIELLEKIQIHDQDLIVINIQHHYNKDGYYNRITLEKELRKTKSRAHNDLRIAEIFGQAKIDLDTQGNYLIHYPGESTELKTRTALTRLIGDPQAGLHFPLKQKTKVATINQNNTPVILGQVNENTSQHIMSSHQKAKIQFDDHQKSLDLSIGENQLTFNKKIESNSLDMHCYASQQLSFQSKNMNLAINKLAIETKQSILYMNNHFKISMNHAELQTQNIHLNSDIQTQWKTQKIIFNTDSINISSELFKFKLRALYHKANQLSISSSNLKLQSGRSILSLSPGKISVQSKTIKLDGNVSFYFKRLKQN